MKNGGVFVSIALLVTITLVMGVILLTVGRMRRTQLQPLSRLGC